MKQGIVGLILGALIAGAVGMAYGVDGEQPEEAGSDLSQCQVIVGYGRLTPGNRCYYSDEVMTGIQNGYIYCSRLTVNCFPQASSH